MSLGLKKKIATAALVLLALWPLAHHGLVRAYGLNPWLFFGWAMYTTPRFPTHVMLAGTRGDYVVAPDLGTVVPGINGPMRDFEVRREALGDLASFAPLVERAFAEADAEGVEIEGVILSHARRRLDTKTARIEVEQGRVFYRRSEDGAISGPLPLPGDE